MFRNPGKLIQITAYIVFIIIFVVVLLIGLYYIDLRTAIGAVIEDPAISSGVSGVILFIVAGIVAWFSTLGFYAFGEMVADIHEIRKHVSSWQPLYSPTEMTLNPEARKKAE